MRTTDLIGIRLTPGQLSTVEKVRRRVRTKDTAFRPMRVVHDATYKVYIEAQHKADGDWVYIPIAEDGTHQTGNPRFDDPLPTMRFIIDI
jgi:hypothetical protein